MSYQEDTLNTGEIDFLKGKFSSIISILNEAEPGLNDYRDIVKDDVEDVLSSYPELEHITTLLTSSGFVKAIKANDSERLIKSFEYALGVQPLDGTVNNKAGEYGLVAFESSVLVETSAVVSHNIVAATSVTVTPAAIVVITG